MAGCELFCSCYYLRFINGWAAAVNVAGVLWSRGCSGDAPDPHTTGIANANTYGRNTN